VVMPSRTIFRSIAALAFAAALFCGVHAGRIFYYRAIDVGGRGPQSPILVHPEQTGISTLRTVSFASRRGTRLQAWYVPSRTGAAVVVTTGTDANRSSMLPEIRILTSAGFGVLAFDWPGMGLSDGKIDWGPGAFGSLQSAIDWLSTQPDVVPSQIGLLGFSAGGAVTLRVAVDDARVRSVVLTGTSPGTEESPFYFHRTRHSLDVLPSEWADRFYGWPVGLSRPIDLIGRLAPRSVLLVGGTQDTEADPRMCEELYDAARDPKEVWIAPGATHGSYAQAAPEEYARRLSEYFRRTLLAK
jgi:uncharacterized protein